MDDGRTVCTWFGYVGSGNDTEICEITVGSPGTKDGESTEKYSQARSIAEEWL